MTDEREPAGRGYWKSLEELARSPQVEQWLEREFPEGASEWNDPEGRREFLKIMGASLALAGVAGCTRQPAETIVPYVKTPEDMVPGRPLYFATAVLDGGFAKGVLVESHLGRPTKIEGNPDHPASLGATDVFGQAAILDLYDPDRSQTLTNLGEIRAWGGFLAAMKSALAAQQPVKGAGVRFLTGAITSPTLAAQIAAILAELPAARWHQWEAAARDNARKGATLAFGEAVDCRYHLDKADVIVSLEADFVGSGPGNLRAIREFTERRRALGGGHAGGEHGAAAEPAALNRLYVAESTPTLTGALADHRLSLRPSAVEAVARSLAERMGVAVKGEAGSAFAFVDAAAKDLMAHPGACLVMAGDTQPPAVHALAHAMNEALGNVGKTVEYIAPVEASPVNHLDSLKELCADIDAGRVALLIVMDVNAVYTAPADLEFARKLDAVPLRVHLGRHRDETAERCHWHVPEAHSLESWSDARSFDGTVTILQPLIAPLYKSARSPHEFLAAFTARPEQTGYQIVQEYWKTRLPGENFEQAWRRALHDGVVPETALPPRPVSVKAVDWAAVPAAASAGMELVFRPDPTVGDGRFANNGWLQELPKPLSKLTWENAALVSPATAARLGLAVEPTSRGSLTDVVELRLGGATVKAPAWIVPGQPDEAVTVHLGYGRTRSGRVGSGIGFNAYALRTSDRPWFASGLDVRKTGERAMLACTQDHWSMEGRDILRVVTAEEYARDPHFTSHGGHHAEISLHPPHEYKGHAWGMAIDLNACVGCNACVVACQSENNIPVVGKAQVAMGREMHWIRVDRYFSGKPESPETHHQPVPCMHCENAPCEVVCPVAATVHSDEGLNDMVYNRCVGTRYCSNNCPYKVRRFNFFLYQDWTTPTLKMARNPDVTVRSRGVMEKCTYCVQRINKARIDARNEGREIKDGEIKTACQQVCPAEAIVFGDINDPASRVARLKKEPRSYGMLTELNTRPRTTYLAAVRNPNPELGGAKDGSS
jgi:molybdopterin-containing oxidoreductase family iron-sulfur binding subunit